MTLRRAAVRRWPTSGVAMKIGMRAVAAYIPEQRVTAKDYAHLKPVMPDWMSMPREKRRMPEPRGNEIMAVEVARKALEAAKLRAEDIDLVLCQSFGGRFIVPGLAGYVHKHIGCRRNTPAWNVQDICASFLDACQIATAMIRSDSSTSNVLVLAVSAASSCRSTTRPTARSMSPP
jgi:3-oxoacyl-[acyl-carrier-protein] synthase-3